MKAVLFDLDDTLYDRNAAQTRVGELILQRHVEVFKGIDREDVLAAFLESDRDDFETREQRFRYFFQLLKLNEDWAGAITETYVDLYPAMAIPVSGAVETVMELGRRFLLGLVSNGWQDVQYRKLEVIGLRDRFSCIVISDEVGMSKPDPRIFSQAAALLKVRTNECLHVGDSYARDVVGAKAAGMKACWLNSRSLPSCGLEPEPDFQVRRLEELPRLLE